MTKPFMPFTHSKPLIYLNLVLSLVFVFLYFLFPVSDADLGWHYRYGESLWQTGHILKTNQFSSLLPDYVWANHSWGYDFLLYIIFSRFSFLGLSIVASVLITLAFMIINWRRSLFPGIALSALFFTNYSQYLLNTGLKSQLISLVCLSLVWRLLETKPNRRHYLLLPLIFWFWANLHGQYLLGLAVLGLYTLTQPQRYFKLLLVSFLVTLINPFGLSLLTTAAAHLSAPTLKYIFEWMPWEPYWPNLVIFAGYSLFFWFSRTPQKLSPGLKLNLLAFNLLALKARRLIPVFLLFSSPYLAQWLYALPPLKAIARPWLIAAETLILIISLVFTLNKLPPRDLTHQSWTSYCRILICSQNFIDFIQHNQLAGPVFNPYRLGGFLIYHAPMLQPFIDGRMVAWHDRDWYPFMDYHLLVHNLPGAQSIFRRYHFNYVITYNASEITPVLSDVERWPIIFRDPQLTIFQNPSLPP